MMSQPFPSGASPQHSPADLIRDRLNLHLITRGRIVVIGLGGIGLWLVEALVAFLQGLLGAGGRDERVELWLVDGDAFTPANAYRMDIPDYGNKAEVVGRRLMERWPDAPLAVRWISEYVTGQNVDRVVRDGDLVLLACDNHKTRHLVNERCARSGLSNVVLISGGNDGVEDGMRGTFGNVQVYWREDGQDVTVPLDRFHPEIAQPVDRAPHELGCVELAAQGVAQLAIVNLAVAVSMAGALLRFVMPPVDEPMYDEVCLDVLDAVCTPHFLSPPADRRR